MRAAVPEFGAPGLSRLYEEEACMPAKAATKKKPKKHGKPHGKKHVRHAQMTFTLYVDADNTVYPDPMVIAAGDQIEWQSGAGAIDIDFTSSPFTGKSFHAPHNGKTPKSGKAHTTPGNYKYTVSGNGKVTDPIVIVDP